MSYRRDNRSSKASLLDGFDGLEEGGLRASSSHPLESNEHENDKAVESLHDRVTFLKRLTGDIHEDVENHNRLLDRMGNSMDASRGVMLGTMERFKMVFKKKSARKTCSLVAYFLIAFSIIYCLIRILRYYALG
ncbi:Bet1-like SNARE 1-1 [Quillaja saponaria]|uniref:Bet1-like SNARE 1-1 n=1 Tax=Quillaja saponaria TaxID=32244 RepID=A0AAD7VL37_QUISA|nr:Bet1-like SNARE 1-1 [Quillaja saponaria]